MWLAFSIYLYIPSHVHITGNEVEDIKVIAKQCSDKPKLWKHKLYKQTLYVVDVKLTLYNEIDRPILKFLVIQTTNLFIYLLTYCDL